MKHIVIFRTSGSFLDYETYNCQELGLAKALVKRHYKVSVILGGYESKSINYHTDGGTLNIYYLKYKGIHQGCCIFIGWKSLLSKIKPDVIQVHDFSLSMSYFVTRWAKKHNVKSVLIQGNYEPTKKPLFHQLEECINRTMGLFVLKNINRIGCKTIYAKRYIHKYKSSANAQLTPIGLDEEKFSKVNTSSDFREKYHLQNKKILLYVGKMEQRRNPMFLLELMQSISNEYRLVLVGEGPQYEQVRSFVQEKNTENVLILGKKRQEELPAIYAAADLFLLASDYEIYGMVILESMYFGVPVISSRTAGSSTLIDKECGRIIDDYNPRIWCEEIATLCNDTNSLTQMKQHCKHRIQESYVWDKAVCNFISLYEEE